MKGTTKKVRKCEREGESVRACTNICTRQKKCQEGEEANTCDNQSLPPVKL